MGIFDRMGKVISSNVNALLDKAEDDRKLLELNLDEMGEQLRAGKGEVVAALGAEKQLKKRVEELRAETEKWEKRAELALKAGDEALAREALKQKKRVSTDAESAERMRAEQEAQAARMKGELERMEQKLDELKARKGTIVAKAAQARAPGGEGLGTKGGGPNAFENFRRMEERIDHREAEASAMQEVDAALHDGPPAQDLEAKFRELEKGGAGSSEIDDELAALKKRIRIGQ